MRVGWFKKSEEQKHYTTVFLAFHALVCY